jgi:chromosome segregation ATPase
MFMLMSNKGLIFVLLLVSVGLGIALIVVNKEAADQRNQAAANSIAASNQIVSVKSQLQELQSVNQTLETNLASTRIDYSNKLAASEANLRTTEANLAKAAAEAKAQADSNAVAVAQRDEKISELESENLSLDKEAASLRVSITNVQARIAATQQKLAKSEGDQAFLLKELKVLQAEEAEMEKKFNDITAVREQLRTLKTEAAIARRLDWMRRGVNDSFIQRGGELLVQHSSSPPPAESSGSAVELRQGGGVNIQTPAPTNGPPK